MEFLARWAKIAMEQPINSHQLANHGASGASNLVGARGQKFKLDDNQTATVVVVHVALACTSTVSFEASPYSQVYMTSACIDLFTSASPGKADFAASISS